MSRSKFNLIWANFPYCFVQFKQNGIDPWWLVLDGIANFNNIKKQLLPVRYASVIVVDNSMSAWIPKTTARGRLPNITYIEKSRTPGYRVQSSSRWYCGVFHQYINTKRKTTYVRTKVCKANLKKQLHAPYVWSRKVTNMLAVLLICQNNLLRQFSLTKIILIMT